MRDPMYYCDICSKPSINNKGDIINDYFNTYQSQKWIKHIKTSKHIRNCKEVKEKEDKVICKYCNGVFSSEGFTLHKERNKPLWEMKKLGLNKLMECNNFKEGRHRFSSYKAYKEYIITDKLPMKRCKVGQISQTSKIVRTHNKNRVTGSFLADKKEEEEEEEEEEEDENITMKIEEQAKQTEPKKKEPDFTDRDFDLMDEYGSVLPFEDYCPDCNNPINDIGASKFLLNYNKIVVCNCDE